MSEQEKLQFKLMVPAGLKKTLEDAAHLNRRSLSSEIVARLEASFGAKKSQMKQSLDASVHDSNDNQTELFQASNAEWEAIHEWQISARIQTPEEAVRRLCQLGILLTYRLPSIRKRYNKGVANFNRLTGSVRETVEEYGVSNPKIKNLYIDFQNFLPEYYGAMINISAFSGDVNDLFIKQDIEELVIDHKEMAEFHEKQKEEMRTQGVKFEE